MNPKNPPLTLTFQDGSQWIKVSEFEDLLNTVKTCLPNSYMLLGGNTQQGRPSIVSIFQQYALCNIIIDIYKPPLMNTYIDVNAVVLLREHSISTELWVGANTTLAEFMEILLEASKLPSFEYGRRIVDHIKLMANVSVRNVCPCYCLCTFKKDNFK